MIWYQLIQVGYLLGVALIWNWNTAGFAIGIAVVGFLLLETINYIEHYGLRRARLANGRYEKVEAKHSWNANYELGRILLYELTRHSDHHYKANKKYQLLDHHDSSPQLPFGYPASMLIALLPPIWFKLINPRLPQPKN
jgi:alkane 1-monooxygenase